MKNGGEAFLLGGQLVPGLHLASARVPHAEKTATPSPKLLTVLLCASDDFI